MPIPPCCSSICCPLCSGTGPPSLPGRRRPLRFSRRERGRVLRICESCFSQYKVPRRFCIRLFSGICRHGILSGRGRSFYIPQTLRLFFFPLFLFPFFTGFFNQHIATSFRKKSFTEAWKLYPVQLDATCSCRFRERSNVNQWLISDLQFVNGMFKNRSINFGARINLRKDNVNECCRWIHEQKYKMLCVNDNEMVEQFEIMKKQVQDAFAVILPEKSTYEC